MTIRAVADTHALLWYLYNDPRLSKTAMAFMDAIDKMEINLQLPPSP